MSASNNHKKDEVDLLELFRRMGLAISRWLHALGRGIVVSIVFLFRKWIPLTIALLVGVGATYIMKKSFTPYYSSEMTLRSNTIPNADMIAYLNRLHSFCDDNNKQALARYLAIPVDSAKKIKDIQAFWVIDRNNDASPDYIDYRERYNVYDTINKRMIDRFVVRVKISSADELNDVKDALFHYVKSNQLFQERNNLRLAHAKEMLERLNYDIVQLDSLQKVKYFEETRNITPEKNAQMVFLQERNTQLLYDDIYNLYKKRQDIDQELNLFPDIITLLNDFTIPNKPYTGLKYYGKFVIPILLALTILVILFADNKKKIQKFFRNY
jgi:hypothetical protein